MRQLCSRNTLFSFHHLPLPRKILVKEYTGSLIHLLRQLNDTTFILTPSLSPRNAATN